MRLPTAQRILHVNPAWHVLSCNLSSERVVPTAQHHLSVTHIAIKTLHAFWLETLVHQPHANLFLSNFSLAPLCMANAMEGVHVACTHDHDCQGRVQNHKTVRRCEKGCVTPRNIAPM